MVVFNEGNVMGTNIDKLTSILGKLSIWNSQSKPFKLRVYQDRDDFSQIQEKWLIL